MQAPHISLRQTVIPYLNAKAAAGFPVRRAYFVGQNYAGHAKEMGAAPRDKSKGPTEPFYFAKPCDCVFFPGDKDGKIPYPPKTSNYQYEGELVVAIGLDGRNIAPADAYRHICGYAVGLDMTRRDMQAAAKAAGRPWDLGKAADASAPMSPILLVEPKSNDDVLSRGRIWLSVNGVVKQDSNLDDMITDIPHVVSFLSQYIELKAGDVIFTGTPEGVGPVSVGDVIEVAVEGVATLKVEVS